MFLIKPVSALDMQQAVFILSFYKVSFSAYSDGEDSGTTYIIVDKEEEKDGLVMAESAFQMNFRQVGNVCQVCRDKGEDFCGHLTFSSFIGDNGLFD